MIRHHPTQSYPAEANKLIGRLVTKTSSHANAMDRLCIGDALGGRNRSESLNRERFKTFIDLGFGLLRSYVGEVEPDLGTPSRTNLEYLAYLGSAVSSGLKLKLVVGGCSLLTPDFFERHPDACLVNRFGTRFPSLSPWCPNRDEIIRKASELTLNLLDNADLLSDVNAIIADVGPASEPIYPANWLLKADEYDSFWFHDVHAQSAFRSDMRTRFNDDLARANERWATNHASWSEVEPPAMGQHPGPFWLDTLCWYRDAKRALVGLQLQILGSLVPNYQALSKPEIILLLPGVHLSEHKLEEIAASSGIGGRPAQIMPDTNFLIQLASQHSYTLQYTAVQDEAEVAYIMERAASTNVKVKVWGENAGGLPALDPGLLADVIIKHSLHGFEYINASEIIDDSTQERKTTFAQLELANNRLRRSLVS